MKKFFLGIAFMCCLGLFISSCSKDDDDCYSCTGDGALLEDVANICEGDAVLSAGNVTLDDWITAYEASGGTCTKK